MKDENIAWLKSFLNSNASTIFGGRFHHFLVGPNDTMAVKAGDSDYTYLPYCSIHFRKALCKFIWKDEWEEAEEVLEYLHSDNPKGTLKFAGFAWHYYLIMTLDLGDEEFIEYLKEEVENEE